MRSTVFNYDHSESVDIFNSEMFAEFLESEFCKAYKDFDSESYKYSHTYYLVTNMMRMHIKEERITFYRLFEKIKTMELDEPEDRKMLLRELENIRNKIKEGDFVNVDEMYMLDYYYFDGHNFMKTTGDGGKFIPEEGFKMVELYGLEFFENLDEQGDPYIKVPKSLTVTKVVNGVSTIIYEQVSLRVHLHENKSTGYYLINDKKYFF